MQRIKGSSAELKAVQGIWEEIRRWVAGVEVERLNSLYKSVHNRNGMQGY